MCNLIASIFCLLLFSMSALADEPRKDDVRDPTQPLGHIESSTTGSEAQAFSLNSILISPKRKLAIINGSTLREGQLVPGSGNVKVQRISAQAVVLQRADETLVLKLSPSITKRN